MHVYAYTGHCVHTAYDVAISVHIDGRVNNAAAAFSSQNVKVGEHHVPVNIKAWGGDCHNAGFVVLVLVLHGGNCRGVASPRNAHGMTRPRLRTKRPGPSVDNHREQSIHNHSSSIHAQIQLANKAALKRPIPHAGVEKVTTTVERCQTAG